MTTPTYPQNGPEQRAFYAVFIEFERNARHLKDPSQEDLETWSSVQELIRKPGLTAFYLPEFFKKYIRDEAEDSVYLAWKLFTTMLAPLLNTTELSEFMDAIEWLFSELFSDLDKALSDQLSIFNERERYFMDHYFGLGGNDTNTLRELAEKMDLSLPEIKILKEKCLNKLQFNNILD